MKSMNYIPQIGPDRDRPAVRDKVVDLEAWKAEHLAEPDGPEPDSLPAGPPERRGRKQVRTALDRAELAATLAVAAAFLALAMRVLLF